MDKITFWNLLDEARTGREGDLEVLRAALRGLSDSDVRGFDRKLRGKGKKLSSRAVRKALMANPELFDGEGWGDDGFEYVCAGIVALGEEVYRSVLRDPSVLSAGTWEEREELQYVAEEVLEERYGDDQDYHQGPLRWQASVSSEKYPVARAKPLEKGFPVATVSWLPRSVVSSAVPRPGTASITRRFRATRAAGACRAVLSPSSSAIIPPNQRRDALSAPRAPRPRRRRGGPVAGGSRGRTPRPRRPTSGRTSWTSGDSSSGP